MRHEVSKLVAVSSTQPLPLAVETRLSPMECRLFQKGAKNWGANYLGHAGKRHLISAREIQHSADVRKSVVFAQRARNHSMIARVKFNTALTCANA